MRLEELYLEGFGHFHQHTIGPLDREVTVLYGPNEAGKSTLLAFVRAVLFGFPQRGRSQYYPPLAGGRHGGRIRLINDAGARYTLERFAGIRGGPFVLHTEAGVQLRDAAFLQDLTGHAPSDLFNNVFAFSLDEIQSEGLMNNSEVADRIYSAGMGASRLPEFAQSLAKRKDALYRPRGRAQKIAELLRDLKDTDAQIKEIRSHADEYMRLTNRQDDIARELHQAGLEFSGLVDRRAEVDRLLEGWNDWESFKECEERLREMPKFDRLPENPIERLDSLEDHIQQAREDRDEAQELLHKTAGAATIAIPGESLLQDVDRIEGIRRDRGSFDNSVRDLPERQGELREMEEALAERLRALGNAWDEDRLDHVDTSLTTRDEVEQWKERLSVARSTAETAGIRLEQDNDQRIRLDKEVTEAQCRLHADADEIVLVPPGHGLEELLAEQDQLEQIRRGRNGFEDSVGDLPERQAELHALESDLNAKLRDLGQGRDESWLDGFNTSIVFRHEVASWKEKLDLQRDTVHQAQLRLESQETRLTEYQTAARTAAVKLPAAKPDLGSAALERQWNALRRTRSRLQDFERDRVNHDNLQVQIQSLPNGQKAAAPAAEKRSSLMLLAILALVGIVLILAGVFLGLEAAVGIAGGLALGYMLFRSRAATANPAHPMIDTLGHNLSTAKEKLDQSRELLVEAASSLNLKGVPTADALDNVEARLQAAATALVTWTEANDRLAEANNALKFQEQLWATAVQDNKSAATSAHESQQEWWEWLRKLGVDGSFTPETVMEFTGRIATASARLDQVRQMRHRVRAIEVDIKQYQDLVRPLAVKYSVDLDVNSNSRIMVVADILVDQFELVRRLIAQKNDVVRRLQQQEQNVQATVQKQQSAAEMLAAAQAQWQSWLLQRGLHDRFTPDATIEFLARVESARTSRTEVRRMRARVAAIEQDIDEFREQVTPLAAAHDISLAPHDTHQLAAIADELIRKLNHVQVRFSDREQAKRQKELDQAQLDQRIRRLRNLEKEHAALLGAGGTDDAEEFRRRVRQQGERWALERKRDNYLYSLRRLSGSNDRFDAFKAALAATDRHCLDQEAREIAAEITDVEHRENRLREERGENNNALAQLTSEESSGLRIHHNILLEQLHEAAREWSRLTLAETLLDRTRRKFERERQPSVIRHAKDIFFHVTDHRYTGLYAPIGEQTITVTDANGNSKLPSELSRGTREQLYLALRFGLILEFGEHAERLPVIVDEVLVNFDPQRASLASEALAKLAVTNQVLVFTCHRTVAEMFAANGAQWLDISRHSR